MHDLMADRDADGDEAAKHTRARTLRKLLGAFVAGPSGVRERLLFGEQHEATLVVVPAVSPARRDEPCGVVRPPAFVARTAEQQIGVVPTSEGRELDGEQRL